MCWRKPISGGSRAVKLPRLASTPSTVGAAAPVPARARHKNTTHAPRTAHHGGPGRAPPAVLILSPPAQFSTCLFCSARSGLFLRREGAPHPQRAHCTTETKGPPRAALGWGRPLSTADGPERRRAGAGSPAHRPPSYIETGNTGHLQYTPETAAYLPREGLRPPGLPTAYAAALVNRTEGLA